jgi:NAD(P)-dependent dehydrogenase (short-subunit alcohol dehydrogenase family)
MFANRIAVVTGGGSGIGRAVCRILAKENASVVVADTNVSGAEETKRMISDSKDNQSKHIALEIDVSKSDSIKNLFKSVNDNYNNRVATVLVNCAGITRDQWLIDITEQDFDKVIDVNLKGTFLATQVLIFCNSIFKSYLKLNFLRTK